MNLDEINVYILNCKLQTKERSDPRSYPENCLL